MCTSRVWSREATMNLGHVAPWIRHGTSNHLDHLRLWMSMDHPRMPGISNHYHWYLRHWLLVDSPAFQMIRPSISSSVKPCSASFSTNKIVEPTIHWLFSLVSWSLVWLFIDYDILRLSMSVSSVDHSPSFAILRTKAVAALAPQLLCIWWSKPQAP